MYFTEPRAVAPDAGGSQESTEQFVQLNCSHRRKVLRLAEAEVAFSIPRYRARFCKDAAFVGDK
jgi:hypothetical protein